MKSVNLKRKRGKDRDKAKEQFWDIIDKIPDEEIRLETAKGRKVRIIEDSTKSIEIPECPDSE
jgi:hypothetical protein